VRPSRATLVNITKTEDTPLEGFPHHASLRVKPSVQRRSDGSRSKRVIRKWMTDALSGDLAPQRAALVLALVAGFQVMRQNDWPSPRWRRPNHPFLSRSSHRLFQQLIEGHATRR